MATFVRRTRLFIAHLVVGVFLFAQVAYAAEACVAPSAAAAMAFGDAEDSDCAGSPNNCLDQCTAFDQSTQHTEVAVPGASDTLLAVLPCVAGSRLSILIGVLCAAVATEPPPRLRFCTLQL